MDNFSKLLEALDILKAIQASDCAEFLPFEIKERIEAIMPPATENEAADAIDRASKRGGWHK